MAERHEHETRATPPNPPSDSDVTAPSWLVYRLNTNPSVSPHGYEIGYWPANSDRTNPAEFLVIENAWGQAEAAARTTQLNLQAGQHKPAGENQIGEEHEAGAPRGHVRQRR